jgi:hypothetical protein
MKFIFEITPTITPSSGSIVFGLERAKAVSYLGVQFDIPSKDARTFLDRVEAGTPGTLYNLSYLNVNITWG